MVIFETQVILAEIPDEVADISITDPQYEEKYLSLYEALLVIIKKIKPGASFFSLYGDRVRDRYEDFSSFDFSL